MLIKDGGGRLIEMDLNPPSVGHPASQTDALDGVPTNSSEDINSINDDNNLINQ